MKLKEATKEEVLGRLVNDVKVARVNDKIDSIDCLPIEYVVDFGMDIHIRLLELVEEEKHETMFERGVTIFTEAYELMERGGKLTYESLALLRVVCSTGLYYLEEN